MSFKEMEYKFGLTRDNMMVNGLTIKCMEKELSFGRMVGNMLVNIFMIKNKDMENSFGMMAVTIKVNGIMVSNMEKVYSKIVKELKSLESGKKERESDGLAKESKRFENILI